MIRGQNVSKLSECDLPSQNYTVNVASGPPSSYTNTHLAHNIIIPSFLRARIRPPATQINFPSIVAIYWIGQTFVLFVIVMDILALQENSALDNHGTLEGYQFTILTIVVFVEILGLLLNTVLAFVPLFSHCENTTCKKFVLMIILGFSSISFVDCYSSRLVGGWAKYHWIPEVYRLMGLPGWRIRIEVLHVYTFLFLLFFTRLCSTLQILKYLDKLL